MDKDLDIRALPEDEITEEASLLYGIDPGPRILVLNNPSTTTLLGVVLEETEDSFLVAIPSRLTEGPKGREDEHIISPFVPLPYIRLMKSAVMSVMYPYGEFADKYLEYLAEKGESIYPELSEVMDDIRSQLSEEDEEDDDGDEILGMSLNTNSGVEEKAQGMSDKELKEYLTKKYKNGEVDNGKGKKH